MGTTKPKAKQSLQGVPHSEMQVRLDRQLSLQAGTCQILNFDRNPRQSHVRQSHEMTMGWGTSHNIERKNLYGRVDGWIGNSFRKYFHFMELARF